MSLKELTNNRRIRVGEGCLNLCAERIGHDNSAPDVRTRNQPPLRSLVQGSTKRRPADLNFHFLLIGYMKFELLKKEYKKHSKKY